VATKERKPDVIANVLPSAASGFDCSLFYTKLLRLTSCGHNCASHHLLVAGKKDDVIVRLSSHDGRFQKDGAFGKDIEAEPQLRACLCGRSEAEDRLAVRMTFGVTEPHCQAKRLNRR
jgi:hypothetical protein